MFKKNKISPEELRRVQDEKINDIVSRLNIKLKDLEKTENFLVEKIIEAKNKKLTAQLGQARQQLTRCLSTKKSLNGMIMMLELTIGERDIASINNDFINIISNISDEIDILSKNNNIKNVENKLLKAKYKANKKVKNIQKMIDNLDYTSMVVDAPQEQSEFDKEIDALIDNKENEIKSIYSTEDKYNY